MIRYLLALALFAGPAAALELTLPVDCEMGERCYIQSYVDRDAGPGYADFTCGSLSYDGHKGTDFRVATLAEMKKGVAIIAAAPGRVRATRDGLDDLGAGNFPKGKDCGNAVVITHDGGWETHYCHLRKGSVRVRSGDTVDRGQTLGLMGLSGNTEFPHLHISVRRDGTPVDPFGAQEMSEACALPDTDSLWSPATREALDYLGGGIVDVGLTSEAPTLKGVRAGMPVDMARLSGPAMILWARFYGLRKDDAISLQLVDPQGKVISAKVHEMPRNRAEEFRYIGRKGTSWAQGEYTATISVARGDKVLDATVRKFSLR